MERDTVPSERLSGHNALKRFIGKVRRTATSPRQFARALSKESAEPGKDLFDRVESRTDEPDLVSTPQRRHQAAGMP
jgi:hypothetical protein